MKAGISTASLFVRFSTEDALKFLSDNKIEVAEVFLESYCEYNKKFGKVLRKVKGDTEVHSVHVLTTQFEPQLYSVNERAKKDSFDILSGAMAAAKEIGAKYYTFHGVARLKKLPINIDYDRVGNITQQIINVTEKYGVSLAYENVHWSYYNYVGFFNEIRKRTTGLKGTLDVKQARLSNVDYRDFIKEMGKDIVTVHLSDVDENGKMVLPGRGITDFYEMFSMLSDHGFDGALLLEVYQNDYRSFSELFDSLYYIKNVAARVFK